MSSWSAFWRQTWIRGTARTRFRLLVILALLAVLVVLLVSLAESWWLAIADAVVKALTS